MLDLNTSYALLKIFKIFKATVVKRRL